MKNRPVVRRTLPRLSRRACLLLPTLLLGPSARSQPPLRIGWDDYPPYQRMDRARRRVQGLDIELAERIAARAELGLSWVHMPWARQLESLKDGSLDLALAASRLPEREAYALWTQPYRPERAALLALQPPEPPLDSLLALRDRRIGLIRGAAYPGELEQAKRSPAFATQLYLIRHGEQGLRMLREGRLDFMIDDPVTQNHLARREGLPRLAVVRWLMRGEAKLMLSRRTEARRPGLLATLDAAIASLKADGSLQALFKDYPELEG